MPDKKHSMVRELAADGVSCRYYSLPAAMAGDSGLAGLAQLPFSLRILAENLLRHADKPDVEAGMLAALARGEVFLFLEILNMV